MRPTRILPLQRRDDRLASRVLALALPDAAGQWRVGGEKRGWLLRLAALNGASGGADCGGALTLYARVWQGAAGALRASDRRADDRRCAESGRGDLTVVISDDQGISTAVPV